MKLPGDGTKEYGGPLNTSLNGTGPLRHKLFPINTLEKFLQICNEQKKFAEMHSLEIAKKKKKKEKDVSGMQNTSADMSPLYHLL